MVDLAAEAGLYLDEWQQYVLLNSLGEMPDGRWAAMEVGAVVPRQNGKGGILEARELAGLFLFEEWLVIHSAHLFDTSMDAFGRLLALIEDTPKLSRRIARNGVSRSHGMEGIRLKTGQRIRFRTRTKGGGRGLTGDCVILDEAMHLSRAVHGALMPLISAKGYETPGPQLWYTGSAVDEDVHPDGLVLAKIRERGLAGDDPRLAYFEFSVDHRRYLDDPQRVATDPRSWAEANPALGIRISPEYVAAEQRSMDGRTFSVERLSIGRWPATDDDEARVIAPLLWAETADATSHIDGLCTFAVDVTPDRDKGSIGVAGRRADGLWHAAVVENRAGTDWIVDMCLELSKQFRKSRFVVQKGSPASTETAQLAKRRLKVVEADTGDYVAACGGFFDTVAERQLRVAAPQPELDTAVAAVATRPVGDAFVWARRSLTDITPLVACTLALWGAQNLKPRPGVVNLAEALARA